MKNYYAETNGHQQSIQRGLQVAHQLGGEWTLGKWNKANGIEQLKQALATAESVIIGAGAGLSTAAGLTYHGERFKRYFFDFAITYGIEDIYSGGFYPFPDRETYWAWWARHIYYNRYVSPPKPVYQQLLALVEAKDYFVLTTNVDHQFQRAGFDKQRLFYTQGDYGLFQSTNPATQKTYDNEEWVMQAMAAQGFVRDEQGVFQVPTNRALAMRIPSTLIPTCIEDGAVMRPNLREDASFVEDEGWQRACAAYADFLQQNEQGHILYLELGVGANTPVIIKFPFWRRVLDNPQAQYACLNVSEAYCPAELNEQSICINGDIGEILSCLV